MTITQMRKKHGGKGVAICTPAMHDAKTGFVVSCERKVTDYEQEIEKLYDTIMEYEELIEDAKQRKKSIQMNAITIDNIYKYLMFFDKLYDKMNDSEKKQLLESFISAVYIYPEEQENGQFLKQIDFKFPVYYDGGFIDGICWDKNSHVESVILMQYCGKREK